MTITLTTGTAAPTTHRIDARGVLFDSDGVLVDSLRAAGVAWNAWAGRWAPSFDFDRDIEHGVRAVDIIAGLVDAPRVLEALADLDDLELDTASMTAAIPGAVELTSRLSPDRWAVITSATRALAFRRLHAAGHPTPRAIVTAEDVRHGKPHPEPYLRGARLLGLDAAACVVFEDAEAGVRSARAAGVGYVVGVGDHLASAPVDATIADLRAVALDGELVALSR